MSGSAEDEAPRLAAELGCTLYEARLRLVAPKPLILMQTDDAGRALGLAGGLGARHHAAVVIDAREVPSSETMVDMDHFQLSTDSIELRGGRVDPLFYDEVLALLPAVHRHTTVEAAGTSGPPAKKRLPGLAALAAVTGSTPPREERVQVVYIYSRTGRPWILRETGQNAGPVLAIGRYQSFRAVSQQLRQSCGRAVWDERLLQAKVPEEPVGASSAYLVSNVRGNDLLAYALSGWIATGRDNPYRT